MYENAIKLWKEKIQFLENYLYATEIAKDHKAILSLEYDIAEAKKELKRLEEINAE